VSKTVSDVTSRYSGRSYFSDIFFFILYCFQVISMFPLTENGDIRISAARGALDRK
jgi:hypothetical protein